MGCSSSNKMEASLHLMQIFNFFPSSTNLLVQNWSGLVSCSKSLLRGLMFVTVMAINAFIFYHTFLHIMQFYFLFGFLHTFTVNAILTGVKPAINLVNFFLFGFGLWRHRSLLLSINQFGDHFDFHFAIAPHYKKRNLKFIAAVAVIGLIVIGMRFTEFLMLEEQLGRDRVDDISIILVPLVNIWNVIPLIYFIYIQSLILFWVRSLNRVIQENQFLLEVETEECDFLPEADAHFHEDEYLAAIQAPGKRKTGIPVDSETRPRRATLQFLYRRLLSLCDLQSYSGDFFGPWIVFSLGWTVFTLCLTIYFVTQSYNFAYVPIILFLNPHSNESIPQDLSLFLMDRTRRILICNLLWSSSQVLYAVLHIFFICKMGISVNEQSRMIMTTVISMADQFNYADRFKVQCIMFKMSTQYYWGVTVWRAFPIERSVFLTLFSIIVTYSFLLLKLRNEKKDLMGEHSINLFGDLHKEVHKLTNVSFS